MATPPLPHVVDQHSLFCTLPFPILENIALEVTVVDPLGPPTDLIALLLTCKHIHNLLAYRCNRHLYARIFRAKFDTRAAYRRFGARGNYTSHLAAQLKVYSQCLTRIRSGDIHHPHIQKSLWTAFLMMVESDGKNESQLLEWADLKAFADKLVRTRLWENRENHNGWPAESSINALALWLMWLTTDEDTLRNETPEARRRLMELVRPYVVLPLRYPSFHAPDNHYEFPLPLELQEHLPYTHMTPHGFYPPYRIPDSLVLSHMHYNLRLEIAVPPITIAAKLLYFARSEATPFEFPPGLPADRAAAVAAGFVHPMPTQEDYRKFNEHKGARVLERGDWEWRSKMSDEEGELEDDGVWRKGLKAKSARWDNDWHRWCYCFNPWNVPDLKGVVYTYGSLNGDWYGRMLIPDMNQYFGMVTSPTFVPHVPAMTTVPISLRLREHHCINPERSIQSGGSNVDVLDDGITSAWFPSDVNIRESSDGVRIEYAHNGGSSSWYERYREGKGNSHNEETCRQCRYKRRQEQLDLEERVRRHKRASEEREETNDEHMDLSDDTHGSDDSVDAPVQPRHPAPKHVAHRPHDQGNDAPVPGVTRPDGPSSGVDPEADIRREFSQALGRDVDEMLDEELGAKEEMEDDASEWDEYVENTCNGIQDIVITGETIHSHGQAWQHYRFYGRVRRWDGLVAFVRKPAFVPELGTVIFRGYLVANQNFIGNWRAFTVNAHAIPLEGPFIASRSLTEE